MTIQAGQKCLASVDITSGMHCTYLVGMYPLYSMARLIGSGIFEKTKPLTAAEAAAEF